MVYPLGTPVVPPNSDLPKEVKKDYEEAALIVEQSPRAAAALLRLALERLCKEQGQKNKKLQENIENMMQTGKLDETLWQACEVVRVIGNEAAHPGEINFEDDHEIVRQLFGLINIIANETITRKKAIKALHEGLPTKKKQNRSN